MPHAPDIVDRIDELLPQTQCRRCGYGGCRPYAEAIAAGAADINRCPPGGDATLSSLARLLGRTAPPLDISRGTPGPLLVARIDERRCIGCTLCIQACPVDAIIGAPKRMHGVLAALCSGCELCIAPCPVDCIDMVPANRSWTVSDAAEARERHLARQHRLAATATPPARSPEARRRDAVIARALARARARRETARAR
jgi:H+/Na+-translocating ferredoxin:NAD+ oxidoreductase subunit B